MQQIQHAILQDLIEQQRQYVNFFFEHLDFAQATKVIEVCLQCKGLLVCTGVGKSGIIAEKMAMTLISTGTRALYLPALNFLHGDIGGIMGEDIVLMLSKSGQTQELLEMIPHLKRKRTKIVAIVSDNESRLAKIADVVIILPVEKELCPFDLAPTTSTAVQLLFGDILSIALMQQKGFTLEAYASNHPSGSIGKKITLYVRDLMKVGSDLPVCFPDDLLVNVIVTLSDKRCGCLLVVSSEMHLLGIFTDGDLRRALLEQGTKVMEQKIGKIMNRFPIAVRPNDLAYEALQTMQNKRYVMVAPVIENERLVGLIRMHDIIHEGI